MERNEQLLRPVLTPDDENSGQQGVLSSDQKGQPRRFEGRFRLISPNGCGNDTPDVAVANWEDRERIEPEYELSAVPVTVAWELALANCLLYRGDCQIQLGLFDQAQVGVLLF